MEPAVINPPQKYSLNNFHALLSASLPSKTNSTTNISATIIYNIDNVIPCATRKCAPYMGTLAAAGSCAWAARDDPGYMPRTGRNRRCASNGGFLNERGLSQWPVRVDCGLSYTTGEATARLWLFTVIISLQQFRRNYCNILSSTNSYSCCYH